MCCMQVVCSNISLLEPYLSCQVANVRSSCVSALGSVLTFLSDKQVRGDGAPQWPERW